MIHPAWSVKCTVSRCISGICGPAVANFSCVDKQRWEMEISYRIRNSAVQRCSYSAYYILYPTSTNSHVDEFVSSFMSTFHSLSGTWIHHIHTNSYIYCLHVWRGFIGANELLPCEGIDGTSSDHLRWCGIPEMELIVGISYKSHERS